LFRVRGDESLLSSQTQATHFDEVLGDFGYTLLAFVSHEVWPVDEFLVDLEISFSI
jgi:hypothetical protein